MNKLEISSPTSDSMSSLFDFLETELKLANVPKKTVAQINIAIDEIFSNIIRYSGATNAIVNIDIDDNFVTLSFTDNGIPYNPLEHEEPDITLSTEERNIGGLGIYMVKKIMDMVSYEYINQCNIFTMKKKIN